MKRKPWCKIGTVSAVFLGGMLIVLASFVLAGFPFATEPIQNLVWIELVFLIALLGIPLFR